MRIIDASAEIVEYPGNGVDFTLLDSMGTCNYAYRLIEQAGRTCYKSEDKATPDSAEKFVRTIVKSGHHSVLEHASVSVRFIIDRGVSHELVRHRLAAFSQESTRYCNYSKDRFGSELTFINPCFLKRDGSPRDTELCVAWQGACMNAEDQYLYMLKSGAKPEEARSVLPNSIKTEIVVTANMREWMHIFTLRTSTKAHPQMREVMRPLLKRFRDMWPAIFEDVGWVE